MVLTITYVQLIRSGQVSVILAAGGHGRCLTRPDSFGGILTQALFLPREPINNSLLLLLQAGSVVLQKQKQLFYVLTLSLPLSHIHTLPSGRLSSFFLGKLGNFAIFPNPEVSPPGAPAPSG